MACLSFPLSATRKGPHAMTTAISKQALNWSPGGSYDTQSDLKNDATRDNAVATSLCERST